MAQGIAAHRVADHRQTVLVGRDHARTVLLRHVGQVDHVARLGLQPEGDRLLVHLPELGDGNHVVDLPAVAGHHRVGHLVGHPARVTLCLGVGFVEVVLRHVLAHGAVVRIGPGGLGGGAVPDHTERVVDALEGDVAQEHVVLRVFQAHGEVADAADIGVLHRLVDRPLGRALARDAPDKPLPDLRDGLGPATGRDDLQGGVVLEP